MPPPRCGGRSHRTPFPAGTTCGREPKALRRYRAGLPPCQLLVMTSVLSSTDPVGVYLTTTLTFLGNLTAVPFVVLKKTTQNPLRGSIAAQSTSNRLVA